MNDELNVLHWASRTAVFTLFLVGTLVIVLRCKPQFSLPRSGWVLNVLVLFSAAQGLEYVFFQFPTICKAARTADALTLYHFSGLTVGALFVITQLVAVHYISRMDHRYAGWLFPVIVYLGVIGLIGTFVFNMPIMLVADSLRAILIALASFSFHRALNQARG